MKYRLLGSTGTSVGNLALGTPMGICEGVPLPRDLFVMTIAVAQAEPDGSKPPTPDLTVKTLGALPSCRTAAPATTTTTTDAVAPAPSAAVPVPGTASYTG